MRIPYRKHSNAHGMVCSTIFKKKRWLALNGETSSILVVLRCIHKCIILRLVNSISKSYYESSLVISRFGRKGVKMFEGLNWLWTLVAGGVAGWLADKIVPGVKVGFLGAIITGLLGGIVGGWLFSLLNLTANGLIGMMIGAVLGAIIVLLIYRAIKKK